VSPKIFESILVAHAEVSEAAAIAVPDSIKGEALVCFCVLKKDANWSGSGQIALAAELKKNVARDLGKALAQREVVFPGRHTKNAERKSDAPHSARRGSGPKR
jgi:acetyl-CoA synthetase